MPTLIIVGLPNWILGWVLAEATVCVRNIRAGSGSSFSLYLVHYPVIGYFESE